MSNFQGKKTKKFGEAHTYKTFCTWVVKVLIRSQPLKMTKLLTVQEIIHV